MQCKYHPERSAEHFCASCNAPLCEECAEEIRTGNFLCFQCAMIQSVSEVGTSIKEKREQDEKKKKKRWGPFHYFVIVSSVLILVMWGYIMFGGQELPTSVITVDYGKQGRVLLFMVDGALKRYAHYEGNTYPERLADLVPKYISLQGEQILHLKLLAYQRDSGTGYRLSLAKPEPGEMNIILTSKGIEYTAPSGEDVK
ncbi:MAG TPA: B-box zinc finger protein [Desulfatiglandales bacterium]|nr:B-box zinc finger protein [Desulfatiglandales bacterium]